MMPSRASWVKRSLLTENPGIQIGSASQYLLSTSSLDNFPQAVGGGILADYAGVRMKAQLSSYPCDDFPHVLG